MPMQGWWIDLIPHLAPLSWKKMADLIPQAPFVYVDQ